MSIDKRSLYEGINSFESDLQRLLENLAQMKSSLQEVVEKNAVLELENQRLREHIRELTEVPEEPTEKGKQELSKSRLNLEKIYEDGFHVCNHLYGSRRMDDESCVFCLEVIYRESGN